MSVFDCPVCGSSVTVPELVSFFRFPKEVELVVELLTGELNVAKCHVCETPTAMLTPLVAINTAERLAVGVVPDRDQYDASKQVIEESLGDNYEVSVVGDYNELHRVILRWLWQHTQPIFASIQSKAIFDMPDDTFLDFLSPMFLASLALSARGLLPMVTDAKREVSSEEQQHLMADWLAASVLDDLTRILRVLAGRGAVADAYDEIARRIPAICFTLDVLRKTADNCPELVNPFEDPGRFVAGFRAHLKNAIAYALAGRRNPQGPTWAAYTAAVRMLRDRSDTEVDPQLLLSPELLHSTLTFADLWNVLMPAVVHASSMADRRLQLDRATDFIAECGFQAELAQALRLPFVVSLPEEPATADTARRLVGLIEQQLLDLWAQNPDAVAEGLSLLFEQMLQAGAAEETIDLIERLLHRPVQEGDAITVLSVARNAIEALNSFERFDDALRILEQVLPHAASPGIPARILTAFWNEAGNVMRYQRRNDSALRFYRLSASSNQPSDPDYANRSRTLRRNVAIILRQKEDYGAALQEFEALRAEDQENADLLASIAVLYLAVNSPGRALSAVEVALTLPAGQFGRLTRGNLLVIRGWAHHLAGDDDAAAEDLALSWADTPTEALVRRSRLASAAMQLRPRREDRQAFVEECRQFLAAALDRGDADSVTAVHMLAALGTRLLEDGQLKAAGILAERKHEFTEELGLRRPWQLDLFLGWERFASGAAQESWSYLDGAMRTVDTAVPYGANADFSLNWMEDKLLLRRTVTKIALALAESQLIPATELVRVFELFNGREMAARYTGTDESPARSAAAILARHEVSSARSGLQVDTFFFVDGPDSVRLGHVTAGNEVHLENLVLDPEEIASIRTATLSALAAANPAALEVLDQKLEPWTSLSAVIWTAIEQCVRPGRQVVFLPGRALTGLPLHLVGPADGPALFESTLISYAPNFATLDHEQHRAGSAGTRPIVMVTKRTDTDIFCRRATSTALALGEALGQSSVIQETNADRAEVKSAMSDAAEIVFICHGADAGPTWGHGICLADNGELPPSLLPIEHAPELRRFVLTWDDLAAIRPTPALVVSTACSTGQTRVQEGGARLGLEQTLFASGTAQIISPLWDVDQSASLEWLRLFYQQRCAQAAAVENAYHAATLELRTSFPHMFYWAPFIINGRITTGV